MTWVPVLSMSEFQFYDAILMLSFYLPSYHVAIFYMHILEHMIHTI